MKRTIIILILLAAVCGGLKAQVNDSIDVSRFVAKYTFTCQTEDAEGNSVEDNVELALQVGSHVTKCYRYFQYQKETKGRLLFYPDRMDKEGIYHVSQEALAFIPDVWTNYPEGKATTREIIFPHIYEGEGQRSQTDWTLSEDTMTICGYLCNRATATVRGKEWQAWYTEEVPTTAGPWKLGGLPGLIVEATSTDNIHAFRLEELQMEAAPILFEPNAKAVKLSDAKLITHRNRIFGDKRYTKNPVYYLPELRSFANQVTVIKGDDNHDDVIIIDDMFINPKAHKYQPLELK